MDYKIKRSRREFEGANFTMMQPDARVRSKMGHARGKCAGVAAENRCFQIEAQGLVAMDEALQQPCAKETCAACQKDASSASPLPNRPGVPKNVFQVVVGQRFHAFSINLGLRHREMRWGRGAKTERRESSQPSI